MSNEHARTENRSNRANLGALDKAPEGRIFGAQALPKAIDQQVSAFSHSQGLIKESCQFEGDLDLLCVGGNNSGQAFDIVDSSVYHTLRMILRTHAEP
jgi:hypothetical protein